MFTFNAYGLSVSSEFPLVELSSNTKSTDVSISRGHVEALPSEVRERGNWFHTSPKETILVWKGVGAIKVRKGCEIIVDPEDGVEPGVLHQVIQGTAFGLLLQQRDLFPLHASAVLMNDQSIAFAGESGKGKSTLASAFHSKGYPLVSDDITAITMNDTSMMTFPGFPVLKLWPDSAATTGDPSDKHYQIQAGSEKILIPKVNAFTRTPHPLKRIYVLENENNDGIDVIPAHKAVLEMVKNCYCSKLIQASIGAQAHMRNCARLVNGVQIYYLNYSRSLQDMSNLVGMIEEHLEEDE